MDRIVKRVKLEVTKTHSVRVEKGFREVSACELELFIRVTIRETKKGITESTENND